MIIKLIKAERILTDTGISIADKVLNPYRGCEFACLYCYIKNNKFVKKKKQRWGDFLDIKINATEKLEAELKKNKINRVLIGSTTDPYQNKETEYQLTREVIKILNKHNTGITILTRSDLIIRDIDVLKQNRDAQVYLTINEYIDDIKNIIEKTTNNIERRYKALRKLNENNIKTRAHIGPYLPYFTDEERIFKNLKNTLVKLVNIELYNKKLGNFDELCERINKFRNINKFIEAFQTEKNYQKFIDEIKQKILGLNKNYNYKINFYFPDFNNYYKYQEFNY